MTNKWILISISICSVILYVFAFIATFLGTVKSIRSLISLQLIFTCLCQSIAFLLPSESLCVLQTFFNSFGELGKLSVSMTMMLMSIIIFNDEMQSQIKRVFLIISMVLSWVIPLVVCSCCVFSGGAEISSDFCWIKNEKEMYIYASIRVVIVVIAIGISTVILKKVRALNKNSDKDNLVNFEKRMIIFCVVLDLMCLCYIAFTVINFLFFSYGIDFNFLFPYIDVINSLSSCVLVIVFVFTKEKITLLFNKMCCKGTNNDKFNEKLTIYLVEEEE